MDPGLLGVNDPSRDLLMSAALAPRPSALARWRLWEARGYDPQNPVAVRWLPLVGWNLRHETLSDRATALLATARRQTWTANAEIWTSAAPALTRLDENGIRWMLLKGAALAWTTYESPSLRILGDLDLLVQPEDAPRAHAILESDGWRSATATGPDELNGVHGRNYVKPPHGAIDLHAFSLRENCRSGVDEGFWMRSVVDRIDGRPVRLPGSADLLLHVCVHGLRWNPVHSCHWVADAASIIAGARGGVDWDVLVAEAHRRHVTLQAHEALDLVRRIAPVEVPHSVLSGLMQPRPSWRARLELYVKARPLYGPGGLLLMWCDWRRLRAGDAGGRTVGFATYLAHTMRLPSRRAILPAMARHIVRRAFQ